MYNKSDDLVAMIQKKLSDYNLDSEVYESKKMLLLLDGYDQFTGDKTILFDDIIRLKRKYQSQIVFSGRSVPDLPKHDLQLVLYNLKELEDGDIRKIFLAYLGNENGQIYYRYILSRNLTRHLAKPLYLVFVLAHIREQLDKGIQETSYIIPSILNKGKLLQSLIVERFIKKYEKDDNVDNLEWKKRKSLEIELLCYLAYQMTYELKNIEVIKKPIAEKLLEDQCQLQKRYRKQKPSEIIKAFLEHNILCHKNDLLSFDKKELRLFFTALYLKDNIINYAFFYRKKHLLSKLIGKNNNVWPSIEKYLIGFIDADILFNSFKKINFNAPIIVHKKLVDQYKLALEFINQKNYPIKNSFINENYLFEINNIFLDKLVQAKKDTSVDYYISLKQHLRNLIVTLKLFNNKHIPSSLEKELNRRYFKFVSAGSLSNHRVSYFIDDLTNFDLKLSLSDVLETINPIDEEVYQYKRHFYDNLISKNNASFSLEIEDKIKLVYHYIFHKIHPTYKPFFNLETTKLKLFLNEVIQDHSDEFLNYFFDRNKTVKPFTLKRYMNFTQKNLRIWFNFNSENIKLENRLRLACFLKPIFLNVNTGSYSFFYFLSLFSSSFDDVLRIPFCDFFNAILNDEDCSEEQKKNSLYLPL
jgi:hypothetical protein